MAMTRECWVLGRRALLCGTEQAQRQNKQTVCVASYRNQDAKPPLYQPQSCQVGHAIRGEVSMQNRLLDDVNQAHVGAGHQELVELVMVKLNSIFQLLQIYQLVIVKHSSTFLPTS